MIDLDKFTAALDNDSIGYRRFTDWIDIVHVHFDLHVDQDGNLAIRDTNIPVQLDLHDQEFLIKIINLINACLITLPN